MLPFKDNIPTDRLPAITLLLIAANVVVYFVLQGGGIAHGPTPASAVKWGLIPDEVVHGGGSGPPTWVTPLSALFLSGGIVQLLANMLFLWLFGVSVEDATSRVRFLAFYVLGGLASLALQVALDPNATTPAFGAAGAIAAVIGGYVLLYPRAHVVTVRFIPLLFALIEVPIWLLVAAWFLVQALFAATSVAHLAGDGGGWIAFAAHAGGFLLGLLAISLFARRRKQREPPSSSPATAVAR